MTEFADLLDLASERVGGQVIAANDDFFAPKENLITAKKPVWIEDKYTDRGKWMDGWESRRRRTPGHDWCILKLGLAGIISKVMVDTSYFRGNYPESCSIDASALEPGEDPLAADVAWSEILPASPLKGDAQNCFAIAETFRYTHLRLNIYPDGGVARLRVYGEVVPDWGNISNAADELDLAAVEHGGRILDCSDKFFSAPQNLLLTGRSTGMHDGWETRRRRGPGHDWVTIRLGVAGIVNSVEVDTSHFKGNYPESCSLEVCAIPDGMDGAEAQWIELLPRTKLEPDSIRRFTPSRKCIAVQVRFNMYPDGGVARLRIYGHPETNALTQARLRCLNSLDGNSAGKAFLNCCGSTKWCESMLSQRPFASLQHLLHVAEHTCDALNADDWKQAFAAHPRIGERKIAAPRQAQRWSNEEQAGAAAAAEVQKRLQQRNDEYRSRFGYIFIVCASGQSGDKMLATMEERLHNDPATELEVAADEQRKITKLRLQKLLNP